MENNSYRRKNIIAVVVEWKGGAGKARFRPTWPLALAQGGAKVGLMDADIYGPSQHHVRRSRRTAPDERRRRQRA